MPNTRLIAVSLALSQLISLTTAQLATGFSYTEYETTPLATYSFAGTLTNFNPPADCTAGDLYTVDTEPLSTTDGRTRQYIWSYFSAGCRSDGPRSCCPSSWRDTAYYTSTGGSCPPGYSRMPEVNANFATIGSVYYYPVISLRSGSNVAFPCCPTVTYTHTRASTTGILLPRVMLTTTLTTSSTSQYIKILCNYLQSDNLETYVESSTSYSIFSRFLADALYIFDDDATQTSVAGTTTTTTSSSSSSSSSTPASPGTSAVSSTVPSNTAVPDAEQGGKKSGLSTGAIAGIAVGVGLPIILIAIYLTYRLTRSGSKPLASGTPWGSSNKTEVGAMEPGIMENPAEYGGINVAGGNKAYN
ncbi:hypothetical protein TWF506_004403 [Arthrobotrys conoides]|uniref:Mid2 domain-containing protein n=1 Tax=Arthrobotrys conoides TaxID=74498 RepID=A0AAN8NJZ8_9PEZI